MANYFRKEFLQFFKNLSKNNHTEWFNENKRTYETEVKIPFEKLVSDLIEAIGKLDPAITIHSKEAIMRINRDVRFSKDKSPYNLYVAAIISATGKKDKEYPGLYIQLGADKLAIYGGAYMLEKTVLQKVRAYLFNHYNEFVKCIRDRKFSASFGEIQGEKSKVMPPEFKLKVKEQPLLAHKNFYYFAELPAEEIISDQLFKTIMNHYKAGKPVNDFLVSAIYS